TDSASAKVVVSTAATAPQTISLEQDVQYDSLGRVADEWTKIPDGTSSTWSVLETQYDASGREKSASLPRPTASSDTLPSFAGFLTAYEYDALGRMKKVTAPDATTVETSYQGARTVQRSVKIATSGAPAGGSAATTTETYDRRRLKNRSAHALNTVTTSAIGCRRCS